jgi:Protein of unknown function (DUF3224)
VDGETFVCSNVQVSGGTGIKEWIRVAVLSEAAGNQLSDASRLPAKARPVQADSSNRRGGRGDRMIGMETKIKAGGTFTVDSWSDDVYDDGVDAKPSRVHLTKTFAGDVVGTSVVDMLAVSTPGEDGEFAGAAYVAVERFTGSVHGRDGAFVMVHAASGPHGMKVAVIPETGSGELAGISGEIAINRHDDGSHTYTFEYELG